MTISSISFGKSNTNSDIKQNQAPKVSSFGGSILAVAAGGVAHQVLPLPAIKPILDNVSKISNVKAADGKTLHNAIKQMHIDTGLKEKGVRIKFLNPIGRKNKVSKNGIPDAILKEILDALNVNPARKGQNAFFVSKDLKLPKITFSEYIELTQSGQTELLKKKLKEKGTFIKGNSVILAKEKGQTFGFHELGHALNHNFSSIGKALQKCRPISMYVPMILGIYGAITKKSKPKTENGKLTTGQKINNFLRDNAGKLAFIAGLPMLIEEGMASIKGQQFAKKLLKPELAQRVLKGNLVAYSTYIISTVFAALGARLAVSIKDGIIAKKEEKARLKAAQEEAIKA